MTFLSTYQLSLINNILMQIINKGFEQSNHSQTPFYHLRETFDCVPHNMLILKHKFYGLEDTSI